MTSKEKAEELIEKFYQNSPKEFGSGKALGHGKSCALIVADELLERDKKWIEMLSKSNPESWISTDIEKSIRLVQELKDAINIY